jgi:chromosomal replication initiation ATPase DnaA
MSSQGGLLEPLFGPARTIFPNFIHTLATHDKRKYSYYRQEQQVRTIAYKPSEPQRPLYRELTSAFGNRFCLAGKAREEETTAICDGMIEILAACFSVPTAEIRKIGRTSAPISRVRQIGMYVCHVALGLTMPEVGVGFMRDRSTVVHACHLIEDMRDDVEFDAIIGIIERIAQAAFSAFSER